MFRGPFTKCQERQSIPMPASSTYKIVPSTGFYPQLNTLLIALQGVAVAAELRVKGAVAHNAGDYLTVQAKHLQEEVRLPLVGPIEAALANRKPDEVHLTVVQGTTSSNLAYWTSRFAEFVDAIFLPFLVSYHERYRSEIEAKHSQSRTSWPAPWQMSWALRNAASHSGKVFDQATRAPVSWRGFTFGPNDEPARTILSLVNGGDILLLLLEMEVARTGVPLALA